MIVLKRFVSQLSNFVSTILEALPAAIVAAVIIEVVRRLI